MQGYLSRPRRTDGRGNGQPGRKACGQAWDETKETVQETLGTGFSPDAGGERQEWRSLGVDKLKNTFT